MNIEIPQNIDLLVRLFFAHMLSDFFLQSSAWAKDKMIHKWRSKKLYWHIGITFVCALLFSFHLGIAIFIMVTHYLIDLAKVYAKSRIQVLFVVDQALHIIVLILSWLWFTDQWHWAKESFMLLLASSKFWLLIFSYGLISFPLGIVIHIFVYQWRVQVENEKEDTLLKAGQWIGILERVLVMTLILLGQFSAIGFLIGAKAILRFKDTQIKHMEYVIIGTLLSLTPTILLGAVINYLLQILP